MPFFGRPAYTMTLAARLTETGATTLLAWGERLPKGRGYRLHFRPPLQALNGLTVERAQQIYRRDPVDFITVLLTAESIQDLFMRANYLVKITEYDVRAMNDVPSMSATSRSLVRVMTPSGKTTSGRCASWRIWIEACSACRSIPSR